MLRPFELSQHCIFLGYAEKIFASSADQNGILQNFNLESMEQLNAKADMP